jgi:hypothetical protein
MKVVHIAVAVGHSGGRAEIVDALHDPGADGIVEVAEPEEIRRIKRPAGKCGTKVGC